MRLKLIYSCLIVLGLGIGTWVGWMKAAVYFILLLASCSFTIDVE